MPPRPPRIVHLGVGNFGRAHQAWYTYRVDQDARWGIVAFSGRAPGPAEVLARQDGLYTLIERGPIQDRLTVLDTIIAAYSGTDLPRLSSAIADPRTALVTLTITEAGYAPSSTRASALGRLTLALSQRRSQGGGPFALVSCDNLAGNGEVLRARVLELAAVQEPRLADWIDGHVAFVSTVVDRITPPASATDRILVRERLGLLDEAPVVCEPFSEWILCGSFPAGRPEWERAGARFVASIEPWERRKLWLLNGGHSLLALLGLPRGHRTVAAAISDPELSRALERFWDLAAAHLPAPDLELPRYRLVLRERFMNARIGYPLAQIAADSLAKLRQRVVPVINAARAAGSFDEPALVIVAAWAKMLLGAGPLAGASAEATGLDADPDLAIVDADAQRLRAALAGRGGEDRLHALLELLDERWSHDDALLADLTRLSEMEGVR